METIRIAGHEDGPELEGVFRPGAERGAVVASPHPLMGGHMTNPVVRALEIGLTAAGIATLAFNWRGVGSSGGRPSGDGPDAVADYRSAHQALGRTVARPCMAAGYSFGAIAALRFALDSPAIEYVVLAAPPADWLEPLPLEQFNPPVFVVAGSCDEFSPVSQLEKEIARLPGGRLEVIEGADHFFSTGGVDEIAEMVTAAVG